MGKSIVATLMGVLIQKGVYTLDQRAPIPEWQTAGDPRQTIRIRDLLQMSSGLRIRAQQDPEYVHDGTLADHWYLYTAPNALRLCREPSTGMAAGDDWPLSQYRSRAGELPRAPRGREGRRATIHSFPQRNLFDLFGIRTAVLETDASGNFIGQGAELLSGRDWARLGNLYLQDGLWNGTRLLPEGFVKFVSTPAPAWVADGRPSMAASSG